jgi:glycosyltransferase involved in cell wall biosynthesis
VSLHVGLDLLFLVPGQSGGRETHTRGLVGALRDVRPGLRLTAFLNAETAEAGPGFWSEYADRAVVLPRASARGRLAWAVGETAGVACAAARAGVDVLHSPANFGPPAGPFARVLTVHDLLFRLRPEQVGTAMRWGTEALAPVAARRAHRVITVSRASRDDIVRELAVPAERVEVIPNGIEPPAGAGDAAAARARLGAGERPILLSVATDLPHKNLPALLEGLARLDPARRPLLAFAGHGTDAGGLLARAAQFGVRDDVRALGALPAARLEDLYAASAGLVTATRWEGFGLPVLEAMARGVPVACSDLPVLREVSAGLAVLLEPDDPGSIATAMRALLEPGSGRDERIAAGRAHAAGFTWAAAAAATAAAYERAAAAAGRGPSRPARASA